MMDDFMPETKGAREAGEEYLSIAEAARLLGVSPRSMYGYVGEGKLGGERVGNLLMVKAKAVRSFRRSAPGRIRAEAPPWRKPPAANQSYVTTILARVRPGQGKLLEEKVIEWRREKKHALEGTSARYVVCNQARPEEVEIVLIWREVIMPERTCREAVLTELREDLAEMLEWETAVVKEGRVLLHA